MATAKSLRQRPSLMIGYAVLALILIVFAIGVALRYLQGLGAVTNLSNPFPWGLWIGFDVLAAIALSAGAFVAAFLAYILRIERYHVHARGAILAGFLGYCFVLVALLLDLGRPWMAWQALISPNPHSVMTEVVFCVFLYTLVLALEFSPNVLRRYNWQAPLRWIRRILIPLIIAGIVLSTLHQSSVGALFLIAPTKLFPLWYSSLLPIYFLITAICVGLAILIIETTIFVKDPESPARRHNVPQFGEYISILLLTYLGVRIGELWLKGRLPFEFGAGSGLEMPAFLLEIGIGVLIPAILFLLPGIQRNPRGPFWVAWLVVIGVILNRFNVAVIGFLAYAGPVYVPSAWEIVITVGLVTAEILIFVWLMLMLVLPEEEREQKEALAATAS